MTFRLLACAARRSLKALALAGSLLALAPAAAMANQAVDLRNDTTSGPVITLGDLFDGAGQASQIMVGRGAPTGQVAVLDAGEVQRIAHMHGLDWDNPMGVRRILVRGGDAADAPAARARMIDALTYARNIAAGEVIQPQDVVYAKVAVGSVPADMPRDSDAVIGKMTRRPERAGAPVAAHDVTNAEVIKRDEMVQVTFHEGGITLTLDGKAVSGAAMGEPVAVMNTTSKKIIQAVAAGPGQAVVGPDADALEAEAQGAPTQIADLH